MNLLSQPRNKAMTAMTFFENGICTERAYHQKVTSEFVAHKNSVHLFSMIALVDEDRACITASPDEVSSNAAAKETEAIFRDVDVRTKTQDR